MDCTSLFSQLRQKGMWLSLRIKRGRLEAICLPADKTTPSMVEAARRHSDEILPGIKQRLSELLANLYRHRCSVHVRGGILSLLPLQSLPLPLVEQISRHEAALVALLSLPECTHPLPSITRCTVSGRDKCFCPLCNGIMSDNAASWVPAGPIAESGQCFLVGSSPPE